MALAVAERLRNQGIGVTVVDPRWVLPVPAAVAELAAGAQAGGHAWRTTGCTAVSDRRCRRALRRAEVDVPCRDVGLPQQFQDHASRGEVLSALGITEQEIARRITGWVAALGSAIGEREVSERVD